MRCPRCGRQIRKRRRRCDACGQDLSVYERMYRLSNSFYNKGLERARVRDLSGAAGMLRRSLEINKENTEARNLLGLICFEMGEAVEALGEWVISKHFQPENNDADYFMERVQSDTAEFEAMTQAAKKYNIALASAKQGSDDLAVIQLKRVISMNPRYVRALLLLALLYLKNSEYEKARRCLLRVQKIDVANVTVLRYLEEIRLHTEHAQGQETVKDAEEARKNNRIAPVSSYREEKPNFLAFVTFFLGILIGVAVIYYMAVPNIRKGIMEEYNQKERDYSASLSASQAMVSSLESNIRILETKVEDLERTLNREEGYVLTDYEPLLGLLYAYEEYLALPEQTKEETEGLARRADALDMSGITYADAIALYKAMCRDVKERAAAPYRAEGMELYAAGQYEDALARFEEAYSYREDDPEILYHLARIYHRNGDLERARRLYEEIIREYPTSGRCQEARTYLGYLTQDAQADSGDGQE